MQDRRIQRDVSGAGDDGEQVHAAAALAPDRGGDGTQVRRGERGLPAAEHHGGAAPQVQGGHRGHLHFGGEGEGHRVQAEAGDSGLEHAGLLLQHLQDAGGADAEGRRDRGDHLHDGGLPHDPRLPHVQPLQRTLQEGHPAVGAEAVQLL